MPLYQVICLGSCGKQPLSQDQYEAGLDNADSPWICPICHKYADWDDDSEVTAGDQP